MGGWMADTRASHLPARSCRPPLAASGPPARQPKVAPPVPLAGAAAAAVAAESMPWFRARACGARPRRRGARPRPRALRAPHRRQQHQAPSQTCETDRFRVHTHVCASARRRTGAEVRAHAPCVCAHLETCVSACAMCAAVAAAPRAGVALGHRGQGCSGAPNHRTCRTRAVAVGGLPSLVRRLQRTGG